MHSLLGFGTFCAIAASVLVPGIVARTSRVTSTSVTKGHCPTVTSTTGCSTCVLPQCQAYSTITAPCDCPSTLPTVRTSLPCGGPCPGGCAGTDYELVRPTGTTCSKKSTQTVAPPVTKTACSVTVTQTVLENKKWGCAIDCPKKPDCAVDAVLTLPCGCSSAKKVKTITTTRCATTKPCHQCLTGYMFTTTATKC